MRRVAARVGRRVLTPPRTTQRLILTGKWYKQKYAEFLAASNGEVAAALARGKGRGWQQAA